MDQQTLMSMELLTAAINGDETKLINLLGLGDDQSAADEQRNNLRSTTRIGETVLHLLASNGHKELAVVTFKKDTSLLGHPTKSGDTPLHCAARYGHYEVIINLICCAKEDLGDDELKVLLRKWNTYGETVLHEAARGGLSDAVLALMETDPELAGEVNRDGKSPLYLATVEGHAVAVGMILANAEVITPEHYAGPDGQTALHAAMLRTNGEGLARSLLGLQECTNSKGYVPFASRADNSGSTALHYAAVDGRTDAAEVLLTLNPSLAYCPDNNTLFPVHVAALMGHATFISWLMEKCPDSGELLDSEGRNFVHYIVDKNHYNLLRSLYNKHGGRSSHIEKMLRKAMNAKDKDGNTPLCLAATQRKAIIKELLDMEWVDVNSREDSMLYNSLVQGVKYEIPLSSPNSENTCQHYYEIRKWMKGNGQDRESWKRDCRHLNLIEEGSMQVTGVPSGMEEVDPQSPLMSPKLLTAARNGDQTKLINLLGLQEDESRNSASVTIDHRAAEEQRNNLRSTTRMGDTVLHLLASNGHKDLAKMTFLKDRSLLGDQTINGDTPLHCAARYGHQDVISNLIRCASENIDRATLETELKVLLRKRNTYGETVLHEAARRGLPDAVEVLTGRKPELVGEVNSKGESSLYLATVEGHRPVVQKIVQRLHKASDVEIITRGYYGGPDGQTALHAAMLRTNGKELATDLLELEDTIKNKEPRGESQEYVPFAKRADSWGSTPLHYATVRGRADAVRFLLDKDPSLDLAYCSDKNGLFPIHIAALMDKSELVNLFMERYPDSGELLDRRGRNFLHIAAEEGRSILLHSLYRKYRHAKSSHGKMLETAINARDKNGTTPLFLAATHGINMIKLFLQIKWVNINPHDKTMLTDCLNGMKVNRSDMSSQNIYQHYYEIQRLILQDGDRRQGWLHRFQDLSKKEDEDKIKERLRDSIQVTGLGSVLIATVTFAAAFALPGGYENDGTPVLARRYIFKAFLVANAIAFVSSFACTLFLILDAGQSKNRLPVDWREDFMKMPRYLFATSAMCMILAFGLGLYVILAPISTGLSITLLVLALSAFPLLVFGVYFTEATTYEYSPYEILSFFYNKVSAYSRWQILGFVLPLILIFSLAPIG